MSHYTHKKFSVLRCIGGILRGFVALLSAWPLILILAFFISPVGPHLRWSYTYHDAGLNNRIYHACVYLGSRGYVDYKRGYTCPLVTMIDRRKI